MLRGFICLSILFSMIYSRPVLAGQSWEDRQEMSQEERSQEEERDARRLDEAYPEEHDISSGVANNFAVLTSLEQVDNFFLNAKPSGLVEVWVTREGEERQKIETAAQGAVIKVHSQFQLSYPEGTYIFYVRPDTGGYENAMIFKGRHSGINKISGTYASFYIPKIGQIAGKAKIYVYIPGLGVGTTTINLVYPDHEDDE